MSPMRFDALARLVVDGVDRRHFLRGIAATLGAVGIMGSGPAFDEVAAKKRKRRKHKRKHKKTPPPNQCPSGQVLCGEECVEGVCCPGTACGEGNCICRNTTKGDTFCVTNEIVLCAICDTSGECEGGARCVTFDSGSSCCLAPCGVL
jgi:hypothetical protein